MWRISSYYLNMTCQKIKAQMLEMDAWNWNSRAKISVFKHFWFKYGSVYIDAVNGNLDGQNSVCVRHKT